MASGGGIKIFVYGVNNSCPRNALEDEFSKFGEGGCLLDHRMSQLVSV
jgi:hypothetical protein